MNAKRKPPDPVDEFVEIARMPSTTEANILRNRLESEGIPAKLDGEATADWLSHLGPTISGVKLLVGRKDADRAERILDLATEYADKDVANEKGPVDADEEDDEDDEAVEVDPELLRAWRAAILGVIFFPPLLNLYSTYILFREGLFLDRPKPRNWRVTATCVLNLIVFLAVAGFIALSDM